MTRLVYESFDELELTSAPLDPGRILNETLWENSYAAVATSATLCALGDFERFMANAGITSEAASCASAAPSTFLASPCFRCRPCNRNRARASSTAEEVAAMLPDLLALEPSALALFTSWRQFNAVVESLPADVRARCQVQDTASKQRLIQRASAGHRRGRAQLPVRPGQFCRRRRPARRLLPTRDSRQTAVRRARQSGGRGIVWLESQNRNAFMEISLPEASLRLVQACGRLVRHETDGGRITLLDRRIVTKRYGEALLDSLPPYRREIG